ncbi:MAG: hypothetical protein KA715_10695 [Xanthomonadaceae bacterium]|nr:hypothetical protein [Xanthomonadaceae bacterium]
MARWIQGLASLAISQESPKIRIDPSKMNKDLEFFNKLAIAHDQAKTDSGRNIVELNLETVEYGHALQQDFISFIERFDEAASAAY